jgi:hypothetical protein
VGRFPVSFALPKRDVFGKTHSLRSPRGAATDRGKHTYEPRRPGFGAPFVLPLRNRWGEKSSC